MSKDEGKVLVKVIFDADLYETDKAILYGNPELGRNEEPNEPTDRVWLPKSQIVKYTEDQYHNYLKGGVEVIIPMWLAEKNDLEDYCSGLDPQDAIAPEDDGWKPSDDIPF